MSMSSPYTAMIESPNRNVSSAAYLNHQSARNVSFRRASERAPSDSSAYAGTCTKLKKYSRPIQVTPERMCPARERTSHPYPGSKKSLKSSTCAPHKVGSGGAQPTDAANRAQPSSVRWSYMSDQDP